jgi:beta-lactamase class A
MILSTAVAVFLLAAGSAALVYHKAVREREEQNRRILEARRNAWKSLEERLRTDAFRSAGVVPGIVVEDLSTGWRIEINPDKLFPSASLAKVPIMASCFLSAAGNKLDLESKVRLLRRDKVAGSGVIKNLPDGSVFSVNELMTIMITKSDNTASNLLIDLLGRDYLNESFHKLGLRNTNLARKMMDFFSRKQGRENYTTARDMAFLLEEIYYGRLINREYSRRCLEMLMAQRIRDRIPARLPPGTPVAHKTGLEYGVCHDAGIVFVPEGNFIICVLTRHNYKNSYPAKRFIARIAGKVYDFYRTEIPLATAAVSEKNNNYASRN